MQKYEYVRPSKTLLSGPEAQQEARPEKLKCDWKLHCYQESIGILLHAHTWGLFFNGDYTTLPVWPKPRLPSQTSRTHSLWHAVSNSSWSHWQRWGHWIQPGHFCCSGFWPVCHLFLCMLWKHCIMLLQHMCCTIDEYIASVAKISTAVYPADWLNRLVRLLTQ